ncbi:MAG: acyl-CoA dehydrogenase family protein [Frankiales bacterium]|nr:acyl-CoA dehydrogenase family protein [Frankiales bacterium]
MTASTTVEVSGSEELRALRSAVRAFLERHAPARSQLAADDAIWPMLTDQLGLTALPVAELHGGASASFVELAVVLEETGRVLLRAPYLSTVVAATVLQELGVTDLLPALADGSTPVALALAGSVRAEGNALTGSCAQVVGATADRLLLVGSDQGLHVIAGAAAGVRITELKPLDGTRPQARVDFDAATARRVGDLADLSHTVDLLHVALACESVGAAERCLEMTVEHLLVREQFGRPLGSFQALRHRIADLTVQLEAARSVAWYASRAAAGRSDDLAVVAPLAQATCADAFTAIAGEGIQLHGGIGFTWEHDAHLFFKRAWTTALLHGDPRALRRRAAARAGILTEEKRHD